MSRGNHELLVERQFGSRAAAYVASSVHATGADLQHLAEVVRGQRAARILDLGCGGGHVSFTVAPHVREVVAYDLSSEMLGAVAETAKARDLSNIVTQQGVAEALPFPDDSFDFVFSRYSAHHWQDVDTGLREARRVLKAAGTAIFMDAFSPASPQLDTHIQAIELLRDPSHVRDYSIVEWRTKLESAGFTTKPPVTGRLRIEFSSWIARMATPQTLVNAIRMLQESCAREVSDHFAIEPDGSFHLDTMSIEASPR